MSESPDVTHADSPAIDRVKWAGMLLGPPLAALTYFLLPESRTLVEGAADAATAGGLSHPARATAAVVILMAVWWLTEAIPLSVTSLLPLALFPLLNVMSMQQTAAPYASDLIFLFLGGFILGLAMEKSGLHRRIALLTILAVGTKPTRLIAGVMLATAGTSMWVSNTATAIMMLPIGMSVIHLVFSRVEAPAEGGVEGERSSDARRFASAMMLGIAYASSIGGVGTLIGTPPNIVLANFVTREYQQDLTFLGWMRIGVPIAAIFLPLTWLYLTRVAFPIRTRELPGGRELIRSELAALGPPSRAERIVFTVFILTALAWMFRGVLVEELNLFHLDAKGNKVEYLTDTGIAIVGATLLFLIPVDVRRREFAMDWATAERLPWGILLLFGGGLSLAAAMSQSGLDTVVGRMFAGAGHLPDFVLVLLVTTTVVFLTELTSNTAVTNALLPVLAAAAVGLDIHPYLLLIPAAIAASYAFMLPMGTPPNALVFASGYFTMATMAKAGFWLNLLSVAVITVVVYFFGEWLLGMDLSVMPDWAK